MENSASKIRHEIASYYDNKIRQFGPSANGVDWKDAKSQALRFEQLCKIITKESDFSLNDLGCGYGALLDHINTKYDRVAYHGTDISEEMIKTAKLTTRAHHNQSFECMDSLSIHADYSVASGIFNVREGFSDSIWLEYIHTTLDTLEKYSKTGFSFNCLTHYSDIDKMKEYLYYADPHKLFHYCKSKYSKNVALLHDYDLYEFTILVRKCI